MIRASVVVAALLVTGTASASSRHCVETGTVVGETTCRRFGQWWATEHAIPVFGGVGMWSSVVRNPFLARVYDKQGTTVATATTSDVAEGPLRSYGGEFRIGGFATNLFYLGFGFGLGLGKNRSQTIDRNGYAVSLDDGINFVHARVGPFMGLRAPMGRLSFRAEVATPLDLMFVSFRSMGADRSERSVGAGGVGIAVEPRIAVDVWPVPDTTISLWAGADVIRPGNMTMGLTLTGHLRAFDGAYW
jgi:hypothetical protein